MLLEKEEFKTPQVRRRGHLTIEERKQLNYLKRKEKVAPLDKAERYELMELEHKAGLYEARDTKKCVICGDNIQGYGNNAAPVADGICCDKCNASKVIPARLSIIDKKQEALTEEQDEYKVTVYNVIEGSRGPIGRKRKVYVKYFPNKEEAYRVAKLELDKVSHTGLGYSYAEIELPDGDVDVLSESLTEGKNLDDIVYDALSRIKLRGDDNKPRHPEVYANPKGNGYRLEIEDDESGIDQVASIAKKYKLNYNIRHMRNYTEVTVDLPERKLFTETSSKSSLEQEIRNKVKDLKESAEDCVNAMREQDPLIMNLAMGFAKGNSHILNQVSNGEKTIEQVIEEVSAQSNFLTPEMWDTVIRCAMFCDRDKSVTESYKVVDKDGNKVPQGGGFTSKKEAEMFAVQYGEKDLKVVKESFEDEHLGTVEETPEPGPEAGIASIINKLIIDEWEAIQGYNDAIVAAETEGYSDIANVLRDIANEENLHVGQLEQCMQQLSPNAESINQGEVEAGEQLSESVALKESTWNLMIKDMPNGAAKKLEFINTFDRNHDTDYFEQLRDDIYESTDNAIDHLFVDTYGLTKNTFRGTEGKPYYTSEDYKNAVKIMFKKIDDYYKKLSSKSTGNIFKESLSTNLKNEIELMVKGDFETGHISAEDYNEFRNLFRGESIKPTKELYNYYIELRDLGPTGFYQEFKDKYDFDEFFVQEFGDEDNEDPEEGMHY